MLRANAFKVLDKIKPQHVLVSVFFKDGLDRLVPGLLEVNTEIKFYSTGGTGKKIQEILGASASKNYVPVETFTGAPEMEGGLVKTLHPKIHAGLLAERGNPAHEEYLEKTLATMGQGPGVYFDILVSNLYPFGQAVTAEDATAETARINIDIGGPGMTMAASKNWHSVAVLTDPAQYTDFLTSVKKNGGAATAAMRFALAQQAFARVGEYRMAIGQHFSKLDFEKDVLPTIELS
jgi:phosphoribosylaminoimidazolecarboxamide formyltransferase/IMP cyclohydrolase